MRVFAKRCEYSLTDDVSPNQSEKFPCSFLARLNALEITEYAFFNLTAAAFSCWRCTSAGSVMAATTPIMPKVIKTSAKVKAVFDFVGLKVPTFFSNISMRVALFFILTPLLFNLLLIITLFWSACKWVNFLPLSGENPRAPPPQRLSSIHAFCLLLNSLTF